MWRLEGLRPRVLVTGIGGPAGQCFVNAFHPGEVDWFVADMDAAMPGFQLHAPDRRAVLPRGEAPEFADALLDLALRARVDAVVPTVDDELMAVARASDAFAEHGIHLLVGDSSTLELCLDKLLLARHLSGRVGVPQTRCYDEDFDPSRFTGKVVVKPRNGSGGRGISVLDSAHDVATAAPADGSHIVQEYLPGAEYSIDVLADSSGRVAAAVPRERIRVDSGIAIAARTVRDSDLERFGEEVAHAVGLTTVANVQVRLDADGAPALLEVNPRFPGTMSLTVASGVNMPKLALSELFGAALPSSIPFREIILVRTWADHVVDAAAFGRSGLELVGSAA